VIGTAEQIVFGAFAGIVIALGVLLFVGYLVLEYEERDRRRNHTFGGYPAGSKPVGEYRRPPAGPAPGAKR
jgi:hypothetical protein